MAPSPRFFSGMIPPVRSAVLLVVGALFQTLAIAEELVLYETDFSDFPVGDGELVGRDGWLSTHPDELVHGIVTDIFDEGDRSGSIGYLIPETDSAIISVYRPIDYDPLEENTPEITFFAEVAVIDSQETEDYDSFYISVFNRDAELLASVVFDNTEDALGIWRFDGVEFFDTEVTFEHAALYPLEIAIDYESNTWSAEFGGVDLFIDAPFSASSAVRDLGDFAVEWEITDVDNPGDNWFLFDNWSVMAVSAEDPGNGSETFFEVTEVERLANGNFFLRWAAEPETTYRVERSRGLRQWTAILPEGEVTTGASEESASFVDQDAGDVDVRFYRVRRL